MPRGWRWREIGNGPGRLSERGLLTSKLHCVFFKVYCTCTSRRCHHHELNHETLWSFNIFWMQHGSCWFGVLWAGAVNYATGLGYHSLEFKDLDLGHLVLTNLPWWSVLKYELGFNIFFVSAGFGPWLRFYLSVNHANQLIIIPTNSLDFFNENVFGPGPSTSNYLCSYMGQLETS